jgi:hypothetical protein
MEPVVKLDVTPPVGVHDDLVEFDVDLAHTSLDPKQWAPREMRHSFVSLLDDANVPIEKISRLVGHADTTTTETVYRFQIRPVIQDGATAMDEIFRDDDVEEDAGNGSALEER